MILLLLLQFNLNLTFHIIKYILVKIRKIINKYNNFVNSTKFHTDFDIIVFFTLSFVERICRSENNLLRSIIILTQNGNFTQLKFINFF